MLYYVSERAVLSTSQVRKIWQRFIWKECALLARLPVDWRLPINYSFIASSNELSRMPNCFSDENSKMMCAKNANEIKREREINIWIDREIFQRERKTWFMHFNEIFLSFSAHIMAVWPIQSIKRLGNKNQDVILDYMRTLTQTHASLVWIIGDICARCRQLAKINWIDKKAHKKPALKNSEFSVGLFPFLSVQLQRSDCWHNSQLPKRWQSIKRPLVTAFTSFCSYSSGSLSFRVITNLIL